MERRDFLTTAVGAVPLTAAAAGGQPKPRPADDRVETNVIYGMYSGLALLMDVHHPPKPNGIGVLYIAGCAWHAPASYNARQLKDEPIVRVALKPLVEAGYTVFVINHRAASRFRYPAASEDAARSVRFVRHHAKTFGVRPDRIGAAGHSSGACLALLLGSLEGKGDPTDADPVNRESARVQAVASFAAPTDFLTVRVSFIQSSYLGVVVLDPKQTSSAEYKLYREASPVSHATKDGAPTLLIHGDADPVVPYRNAELMEAAMTKAGATGELVRIKGGGHFPPFPKGEPDPFRQTVRWFDKHLR